MTIPTVTISPPTSHLLAPLAPLALLALAPLAVLAVLALLAPVSTSLQHLTFVP